MRLGFSFFLRECPWRKCRRNWILRTRPSCRFQVGCVRRRLSADQAPLGERLTRLGSRLPAGTALPSDNHVRGLTFRPTGTLIRCALLWSPIKATVVAARRRRRTNTSQLITRQEIEDLCEEELRSKLCAIMNELISTLNWQAERG
jgi:hypothetical protein